MDAFDDMISNIIEEVANGTVKPAEASRKLRSLDKSDAVQEAIIDNVWVHSLKESEQERGRLQHLIALLTQDQFIPLVSVLTKLESDLIPPEIITGDMLRRKRTQAKTKKVYTVPKYNLLSECPEGFAALVDLIWSVAKFGHAQATTEELVEQLKRMIGQYSLCPNKALVIAITMLSWCVEKPSNLALIELIRHVFPVSRIGAVIRFHLLSFGRSDEAMTGPSDPQLVSSWQGKSTPRNLIKAIVFLHQAGLVDVSDLWSVMTPSTVQIENAVQAVAEDYAREVENSSKTLGVMFSTDEGDACQALPSDLRISQSAQRLSDSLRDSQRFMLLAELIRAGEWSQAFPLLNLISAIFSEIPVASVDIIRESLLEHLSALAHQDLSMSDDATELFITSISGLINYVGVYVGSDSAALVSALLKRIQSLYPTSSGGQQQALSRILSDHLVPAISIMPPNPHLCALVWDCIGGWPAAARFEIYQRWDHMYSVRYPLKLVKAMVNNQTRSLLKRVVKGAQVGDLVSRNSHLQFAKICCFNPLPALRYAVNNILIPFNYNLIEPYVEVTSKIPSLSQDMVSFLVATTLVADKPSLNLKTASVEPWISHLSEFAGRFFKRHPNTPLDIVFKLVAASMSKNSGDNILKITPARVLLEATIAHMGNFEVVDQLNADQLESVAGGPLLNKLSQSSVVGGTEGARPVERSKAALKQALLADPSLVPSLWFFLTYQQYQLSTSQKVAQDLLVGGGLKLLGILSDGIHRCVLQLTEFLVQNTNFDEYRSLLPSDDLSSLFKGHMDLGLAFHILRAGLGDIPLQAVCPEGIDESLSTFFWRRSLSDIKVPTSSYQKQLALLSEKIESQEQLIEKIDKARSGPDTKDQLRAGKRELTRLRDVLVRLECEFLTQSETNRSVIAELKEQSSSWFSSSDDIVPFVTQLLAKRIVLSIPDALFCFEFVKLISESEGFDFSAFMDTWTPLLPQLIGCSSEGEVKTFGEFAAAMMKLVVEMRIAREQDADFKAKHTEWEMNICRSLGAGLSTECDWSEKRNCLLLISKTCETFPVIEANALMLKGAVDSLSADPQEDISTLATSLSRKMASLESKWMDKAPKPHVKTVTQVESPKAKEKPDEPMEEPMSDVEKKGRGRLRKPEPAPKESKPELKKPAVEAPRTQIKRPARDDPSDISSKRPKSGDDRAERHDREPERRRGDRNQDSGVISRNRDRGGVISRR